MKFLIIALLISLAALELRAADEPFIPAALNAILTRIKPGMGISEVEAILAPAYPGVKGRMSDWSGKSGYVEYKLDARFSLSVSSTMRDGKEIVHDKILFYLYDWPAKRRLDVKVFDWDK